MKKYRVNVNGTDYEITLEALKDGEDFAPKAAPAAAASSAPAKAAPAAAPAGSTTVSAPMPGNILDVKVSQGQAVKAGQTLLILEAMKMENEIQSPVDGTVASVNVTKGSTVETGAVLVVIS